MVGCGDVSLSSCSPSCVCSIDCIAVSSCDVADFVTSVCSLKTMIGCLPRSMLMIGHLPPLWFSINLCSRSKVLLCLDVLSFELCLYPPKRCVFVSGW